MSDNIVTIDKQSVDELLAKLSDNEQKNKWLYEAIMSGAKALQQAAQQSFKQTLGDAASHTSPYLKGGKPFYEGVSVKGDKAYLEASVSIMNDYRMKFLEKGTKDRQTKGRKVTGYIDAHHLKREGKGHYTGKITATNFFRSARDNSQSQVEKAMIDSLNKSIQNAIRI